MKNKAKGIAIALAFVLSSANVIASGNEFSYLTDNSTIITNYEIEEAQSPFANLVVLPYGMEREDFNAETADDTKMMFKMCYTVGGSINEEIQLSDKFNSGAYVLYIECGEETDRNVFVIPSSGLSGVVSSINSGSALDSVAFGADNAIFTKYKTDIAKLVKNARPEDGYTNQSFLDSYMASEGMARFKGGELTLDEFVDLYDSYYGTVFETCDDWVDTKKQKYISVLKKHPIGNLSAVELANDSVFVSEYVMATDAYKLQDLTVKYFKEQGLDISKYNSLNTYQKYSVFESLFESRTTLGALSDIYDKFTTQCNSLSSKTEPTYKPAGGGGGGGGGIASPQKPEATPVPSVTDAPVVSIPEPDKNEVFTDIQGHWAKEYILRCHENDLVNGFDDNSFRPDKNLSRAELTVLLTNLLGLDENVDLSFGDVSKNAWYYDSVSKAYGAGIISGYDGNFMPENNVTRQDMAVMISRSLGFLNIELSGERVFADSELISDYAAESVAVLGANGIITGDNSGFRPKDFLTRAEAATIICHVYDYITGGGV